MPQVPEGSPLIRANTYVAVRLDDEQPNPKTLRGEPVAQTSIAEFSALEREGKGFPW